MVELIRSFVKTMQTLFGAINVAAYGLTGFYID